MYVPVIFPPFRYSSTIWNFFWQYCPPAPLRLSRPLFVWNRVGAHFQLSLASYSFIISAPISKWGMPKMPQWTPMDLSMLALAHTHAFTHIQRPCSNPNIMSALPAFFCGPAKTKVLTMEEWGCVFLRFCILSKRAKPICGHARGLEA